MFNKPTEIVPGLGSRLKKLRGGMNMSQEEFGDHIGKTKFQVSEMEREKSGLTIHTLSFLMKAFSVNPFWLFFGEGEQTLDLANFSQESAEPSEVDELRRRIEAIESQLNS